MDIRSKNHSPRALPEAVTISLLSDAARTGRNEVLLDGRLQVVSWKGVNSPDRLLIEAADAIKAERIVAAMVPSALSLIALKKLDPNRSIAFYHLDLFNINGARNLARRHAVEDLELTCEPVMPQWDPAPDLILSQIRFDGEAALSLETLRQAHQRLAKGGKLLVAINNPHDRWLAEQLQKMFGNLSRVGKDKRAMVYSVKKKTDRVAPDPKLEQFLQQVEVKFDEEVFAFETSYGTFSSHALDDGSGALLESIRTLSPCKAILDLGCGWGVLGILAARKLNAERLTMIDANARAVDLARRNLKLWDRPGGEVRLESNAESILEQDAEAGAYDLVITNAPYGTEFRVTELFIQAAHRALRSGGRFLIVGKHNPKMLERTEEVFGNAAEERRWGYQIVGARRG